MEDRQLNNMLVRKNVLNEVNKEGTFTQGFKDSRKIKRKKSQNLDDLQNLMIKSANKYQLINQLLKSAQRKRGYAYFMSFHLV